MHDVFLVTCLGIFSIAGVAVAAATARRTHRLLNFPTLVIFIYVVTNLVSGIAHLLKISDTRRGYFDTGLWLTPAQLDHVVLIQAVGLIAICSGVLWGLPTGVAKGASQRRTGLSIRDRAILPSAIAVLLPVSLWASLQVSEHVATLGIDRIIAISGGMARYSYMSHWLVWAISLSVIWLTSRRTNNHETWRVFALSVGVTAIAASLQWNGGRSIILVMTLPLILVLLPRLRRSKWVAGPVGLTIGILYVIQISENRNTRYSGSGTSLVEWLDWQWGRFSMLGYSVKYVDDNGLLWGETFAAGAIRFVDGVLRLAGLQPINAELRSSTNIAAESLLNSSADIYIVPGMSAELYMNFGMAGIFLGYFVLGWLCSWADAGFVRSATPVTQLAWAYVGTLLVFRTIPVDSASAYSYLVFSGAPLLMLAAVSFFGTRGREGDGVEFNPETCRENASPRRIDLKSTSPPHRNVQMIDGSQRLRRGIK